MSDDEEIFYYDIIMNIKLRIKKFVSLFFLFFMMFAIFNFSAQSGNDSNGLSSSVSRIICRILFFKFNEMTSVEQAFVVTEINYFVRKLAHFTAYAVLGICAYANARLLGIKLKGYFLPAVFFCTAYAIFDEIHQYFTPGRTIKITDMMIDTSGAVVGAAAASAATVILIHIATYLRTKKKNKSEEVS